MPSIFIRNLPLNLSFSSALPKEIVVSTDDDALFVRVFLDNNMIFNTRLYAVNGEITIYDIASLVNFHLSTVICKLRIDVSKDADGSLGLVSSNQPYVILCSRNFFGDTQQFIKNNFLSTLKSKKISRSATDFLHYTLDEREDAKIVYHFSYVTDNSSAIASTSVVVGRADANEPSSFSIEFSYNIAKNIIEQKVHDVKTILSCTITVVGWGTRSFTFFFVDDSPSISFYFSNAFGFTELLEINAVSSIKTDFKKEIASSNKSYLSYNKTPYAKHEVLTAPLNFDVAYWLEDFFNSDSVKIIGFGRLEYEECLEVIITDVDYDIADSDKELPQIKFSWILQDALPALNPYYHKNIFSRQYNHSFE